MEEPEVFDDEFNGLGGCYVFDPAAGKRVPEADFIAAQQAEADKLVAQQARSIKNKPAADVAIDTTGA